MAIDGTKIGANASRHCSRRYQQRAAEEAALTERVQQILAQAATVDAGEEAQFGKDRR